MGNCSLVKCLTREQPRLPAPRITMREVINNEKRNRISNLCVNKAK